MTSTAPDASYGLRQRTGWVVGPAALLLTLLLPPPPGLSVEGWLTAGAAMLMAAFWIAESIPIPATALLGVVARIVTGPHDANRQDPHLPMRYDTGRPRSVIRLRISQPRTTSLPCPAGLRARMLSPMMDLYRKNVFSTRP